ncbi:hypothetical protein QYM36_006263 [Artemia franciscana]|uniref:BTB domain-containing protein n=1 Tax=Artemia franciscana TaxID=6661 RepID=A0AA88L5C3_ARTSF|nr:hypothetical protein QYM36_006263 [Artemia franciscana]
MEEQEFCLRWSNHEKNMSSVMESMFKKQILVDVTLSCSEGNPVKAHRTVLSACSPYFETLFNDLSHPHPVVFMKDVKNEDLQALLSFMYKGEANVKQNRLNAFIKLAEALSVRGLSKTEKEEVVNPPPPLKEIEKKTISSFTGLPGLSHMPMFFPNLSLVSDKAVQERFVANSFVEEAIRKRKRLDPEPACGINNNEGSPCSTSEESSPSMKEKSLSAIAAQLHQKKILAEQGNSPFCYPPKLEQPLHTEKPEYLSHENSEELSDVENIVEELHHENRSSPSIKEENANAGPSTGHLTGVNGAESPGEEKGIEVPPIMYHVVAAPLVLRCVAYFRFAFLKSGVLHATILCLDVEVPLIIHRVVAALSYA